MSYTESAKDSEYDPNEISTWPTRNSDTPLVSYYQCPPSQFEKLDSEGPYIEADEDNLVVDEHSKVLCIYGENNVVDGCGPDQRIECNDVDGVDDFHEADITTIQSLLEDSGWIASPDDEGGEEVTDSGTYTLTENSLTTLSSIDVDDAVTEVAWNDIGLFHTPSDGEQQTLDTLDEVKEIIEKRDGYGDPHKIHESIADVWSWYLSDSVITDDAECDCSCSKITVDISPHQAARMLELFKIARERGSDADRDDGLDAVGYSAIAASLSVANEDSDESTNDNDEPTTNGESDKSTGGD